MRTTGPRTPPSTPRSPQKQALRRTPPRGAAEPPSAEAALALSPEEARTHAIALQKRRLRHLRISRALRFVRILAYATAHFSRRVLAPVLVVAAYLVIATVVLRWDIGRAGEALGDFQDSLYRVYRQLFFEPVDSLPARPIGRALTWLTPMVGVVLVAQGLVKAAATVFDDDARRKVWDAIMTDQMRDHVVVCGLGHVGYRVVEELMRLHEEVVAIESDAEGPFLDIVRRMGVPVHIGDARRDELLVECGVDRAKAVVCATSNDLANLEIALDSKRMNPRVRVVMRMFDQRVAQKVGGALELDESFSTSALSAPLVAIQSTHDGVRSAYRVDEELRLTAEVTVGPKLDGAFVFEVEERAPCRVVRRRAAEGKRFHSVRGRDTLAVKDVVLVDTAAADIDTVREILGA
ncbi:MAG: NAD-binding protein [Polyangiaceae bacterium]